MNGFTKIAGRLSLAFAVVALFAADAAVLAQDLHPSRRPSPMAMARTQVGDAYVQIVYSRPYKRGRENVFGTAESEALVPYGELWRTGANEATTVTVTEDVKVGGKTLPAGTYSLFTTPGKDQWTFHFNSVLGLNGAFARNPETGEFENRYDAANNVLEVTATPGSVEEEVDQFTIAFEDQEDGSKHLVLTWITTEVRVPVTAG